MPAGAQRAKQIKKAMTLGAGLALLFIAGFLAVSAYVVPGMMSEPERIRVRIDAAVEAGRGRQVNALLSLVGNDFADPHVEDKQMLADVLKYMYMRYKRVTVDVLEGPEILWSEAAPDEAEATMRVRIMLGADADPEAPVADGIVQETRGTDFFRLKFRKDAKGEWFVVGTGTR